MNLADTPQTDWRQVRGRVAWPDLLLAQRGSLTLWIPVCLGIGIGIYFALGQEPDAPFWMTLGLGAAALAVCSRVVSPAVAPVLMGAVLIAAGMGLAKARTEAVGGPLLDYRYYGPVEGRVVGIDRSASDAVRLTLDRVRLSRMPPDAVPTKVRISLHGVQPLAQILPGERVMTTGHLSPPAGPAEPGGFDFQRHAWFQQIGAVGYTRNPVLRARAAEAGGPGLWIFEARMGLSQAVQARLPGETGAFAAAIMTGDRSGMGQGTLQALRDSNLAHLLAISGLHMGLLTGFVFAAIRLVATLIPPLALRWPVKKIAAAFALLVGAGYLALSGGNVATERAFVMVGVMFVAVLLDRRALTLRAVAIAATIVLVMSPEALVGPGFQMSFAATTALVVVFRWLRGVDLSRLPGWFKPILTVIISSFVAGMATAPIAAAHFNQFAHYGLIANLLSVPLMGALVMPAAVLAACLAPFGAEGLGLMAMGWGLDWILWVARTVAGQEGAVGYVKAPGAGVLPLFAIGAIWAVLWRGPGRFIGIGAALIAGFLWQQSQRPSVLVADTGGLIGVLGPDGRALSRATGNGFAAMIWMENDGAPMSQERAATLGGFETGQGWVGFDLGDWRVLQIRGSRALEALVDCGGADVLIVTVPDEAARPCAVFDELRLRETGSLALDPQADGTLAVTTAAGIAGARPWNGMAKAPSRIVLDPSR